MVTIVQLGSTKTPAILEMVIALGAEAKVVERGNFTNEIAQQSQAIILSGSPIFFTEVDFQPYREQFRILNDLNIPVLGICFGHQLLGLLNGAHIFRGEAIRTATTIRKTKEDVLLKNLDDSFTMQEDHTEGITLPPGFIHLASSDSYIIETMRHPTKSVWGVQFHPEVSEENGKILLGNFLQQLR